jgi:hypothetical protein
MIAEVGADVEVVYHELLERLGPAERAELARVLLDDGSGTITSREDVN